MVLAVGEARRVGKPAGVVVCNSVGGQWNRNSERGRARSVRDIREHLSDCRGPVHHLVALLVCNVESEILVDATIVRRKDVARQSDDVAIGYSRDGT